MTAFGVLSSRGQKRAGCKKRKDETGLLLEKFTINLDENIYLLLILLNHFADVLIQRFSTCGAGPSGGVVFSTVGQLQSYICS